MIIIVCVCRSVKRNQQNSETLPLLRKAERGETSTDLNSQFGERGKQAEIAAQMCLRSVDKYTYKEALPHIGSRLEKTYFHILHEGQQEMCMGQMIEKA